MTNLLPTRFCEWLLLEEKYSFNSVIINAPYKIKKIINKWGNENIPQKALNEKGREKETHVTVIYGIVGNKIKEIQEIAKEFRPFKITLGDLSLFQNENFDVIKVDVICPPLKKLNQVIKDALNVESKFPDYKPHITIAYLHPKSCEITNPKVFEGLNFKVEEILFSNKEGYKTPIKL